MTTKLSYRPDIDGLRAVAVLGVLIFHAFPSALPGGFIGVDVFFVISGSLITQIILSDIERGSFLYKDFYGRRIRRLFPSLLVVLSVNLLFGALVASPLELKQLGKHTVAAALSVANLQFWREAGYFDGASELKSLLHMWSLGVEEQFYLLWPAALLTCHRRALDLRRALIVIIAASFVCSIVLAYTDWASAFFLPIPRLWELGLGGLLAVYREPLATVRIRPWQREGAVSLACLVLLASMFGFGESLAFPGWWALLPTSSTAVLIGLGAQTWLARRVLSTPALVFVGLISYPLYLWHWPLLSWGRTLSLGGMGMRLTMILALASLPLAWLTYRLVERPLRFGPSRAVTISLAGAMAMVTLVGLADYLRWTPLVHADATARFESELARDDKLRNDLRGRQCDEVGFDVPSSWKEDCGVLNAEAQPTIVLWGDSFADAWQPLFAQWAKHSGFRFVMLAHFGCPPLLGVRRSDTQPSACQRLGLAERDLALLRTLKPSLIVMAGRWTLYRTGHIVNGRVQHAAHFITRSRADQATVDSSLEALRAQLPKTVAEATKLAPVLMLRSVPGVRHDSDGSAMRYPDGFEWTKGEVIERERIANQIIDDAAAASPKVYVFDPAGKLCDDSKCSAYFDDTLGYFDDSHLTAQLALTFQPELARVIAGMGIDVSP